MTPAFEVYLNGKNITPKLSSLANITITENAGTISDSVTLALSDKSALEFPPIGGELNLKIGWQGAPLVDKGVFTIDQIAHSGPPRTLTVYASSANLSAKGIAKKTRSFPALSLGEITQTIAQDNGLTARVSPALSGRSMPEQHQRSESDFNFLTRIASEQGAFFSVKNGYILLVPFGGGVTVSGKPLAAIVINSNNLQSWNYRQIAKDTFTGVSARWYDENAGAYKYELAGTDERTTQLQKTYYNQQAATQAAIGELKRLNSKSESLSLVAPGLPQAGTETPVNTSGLHPTIDAKKWVASRVSHKISSASFLTDIETIPAL